MIKMPLFPSFFKRKDEGLTVVKQPLESPKTIIKGFRINPTLWDDFKKRYKNPSQRIRTLIENDLKSDSGLPIIKSGDWEGLKQHLEQSPSLEVVGDVGQGKTSTVCELIKNSPDQIFLVFDAHNEYSFLPQIDVVKDGLTESCRIVLPAQVSATIPLVSLFSNQILTKKWPYVFVFEESNRYNHALTQLSMESRKFAKCIFITQRRNFEFIPAVKVMLNGRP